MTRPGRRSFSSARSTRPVAVRGRRRRVLAGPLARAKPGGGEEREEHRREGHEAAGEEERVEQHGGSLPAVRAGRNGPFGLLVPGSRREAGAWHRF